MNTPRIEELAARYVEVQILEARIRECLLEKDLQSISFIDLNEKKDDFRRGVEAAQRTALRRLCGRIEELRSQLAELKEEKDE